MISCRSQNTMGLPILRKKMQPEPKRDHSVTDSLFFVILTLRNKVTF